MGNASHCKLTLPLQVIALESDGELYRLDIRSKVSESRLAPRFAENVDEWEPVGESRKEQDPRRSAAGIPPVKKPCTVKRTPGPLKRTPGSFKRTPVQENSRLWTHRYGFLKSVYSL